jgi:hypothetical protein
MDSRKSGEIVREEVEPADRFELAKGFRQLSQTVLAQVQVNDVQQLPKSLGQRRDGCMVYTHTGRSQ